MLAPRELATVLAALRHWQQASLVPGNSLAESFPQFDGLTPLTASEIDALCECLNSAAAFADEPCECAGPGCFYSSVPGIIAAVSNGRLLPAATVERCDLCERYVSDAVARAELVRLGIAPAR